MSHCGVAMATCHQLLMSLAVTLCCAAALLPTFGKI